MKKPSKAINNVINAIGVVLCILFGLMLAFNITIIVKGLINSSVPPSIFGITPLVVKSGSMSSDVQHSIYRSQLVDITDEQVAELKPGDTVYTMAGDYKLANTIVTVGSDPEEPFYLVERPEKDHIEVGDLIFSKTVSPEELKIGDVISYMENSTVVTHRIIGITNENGELAFTTKGDANNTEDSDSIPASKLVGIYKARVPALGDFIYFLQKPLGMAVFIGVPVLTFIIYDIIRRSRASQSESGKTKELEAELERLRALANEKGFSDGESES